MHARATGGALLGTTSVLGTGRWGMRVQETEAWWILKGGPGGSGFEGSTQGCDQASGQGGRD